MRYVLIVATLLIPGHAFANLLRNAEFQDDWITLLPETKNHHWCFPTEFYNRRDYNPDGWYCKGSWDWQNADGPWGTRRMVITGPAELYQRVNWIAIHDDRKLAGFPDAGGFPVMVAAKSKVPEKVVRDLTFRVKLAGADLPNNAGVIEVGLHPPTALATHDPMGERNPATVASFVTIPAGTYAGKWIEVKLRAADWLEAARLKTKVGEVDLPAVASVAIRYTGKSGKLQIDRAELLDLPSPPGRGAGGEGMPNLLPNGTFESLDKAGYPTGWSKPVKYRYFPPRHYYIFNTWHNTGFPNRGSVEIDKLIPHSGKHSLRMIVPAGDETAVVSEPIVLNQKDARLIEVTAWVKTDRLCMLQIDGHDEKGQRLDGFNFIHKAPVSIGTDKWRMLRQVFRPRTPIKSLRLTLAARGVNGYTLDDTSTQPQNNVVGTIWWDDVKVSEPEASAKELKDRGVKPVVEAEVTSGLRIVELDLGERLLGPNVARVTVENLGPACTLGLGWSIEEVRGSGSWTGAKFSGQIAANSRMTVDLTYQLTSAAKNGYAELRGNVGLSDGTTYLRGDLSFGTWAIPIKLDLGALYLRPEQKQFVRMNFGFSQATMAKLKTVRLDVLRRADGKRVKSVDVYATPKAVLEQRNRIPVDIRDDFANLLLADLDVSFLPVEPFAKPERNWIIRATAIGNADTEVASVDSQPFCRLAHDALQPAIQNVTIKNGMTHINGQPWMPFGVCYGHTPVYDGPADPGAGKYRDLRNLPGWSMYDRHNSNSSTRKQYDFNCMRYVAGSITPFDTLNKRWTADNLYCSSAFAIPTEAMSLNVLFKKAGGQAKLDAYLAECGKSPHVVSIAPGIEEAFGLFQGATPAELKGLEQVVDHVRKKSGRPVMVGHGGYWNRLEFERVPFFDIYDPETEPLYPANIHTDLAPLVASRNKIIWLRPQMYESIPYERWRFHTYVELMRGCRGWQIAHGPGDASLFRGLHGEMEFWKPIVATAPSMREDRIESAKPAITIEPWIEHRAWKHNGKTYLIAATTHGIPFGSWTTDLGKNETDVYRSTHGRNELRDETNAYGIGGEPESGGAVHGVQYLPDAKAWPKGSKLTQLVAMNPDDLPKGLAIFVKADGRWTHVATWGKVDLAKLRTDPKSSYWFLNTFYRHAKGFLGWGTNLVEKSLDYIPSKALDMGSFDFAGRPPEKETVWHKLELSLDKIGAAEKLIDGVAFLHDGGRVTWGETSLNAPDGTSRFICQEFAHKQPQALAQTTVKVPGLKAGTKIRVLFEDREIVAKDGFFVDDFRGQDLYQRYGGTTGYGHAPVALHAYEIP